MLRHLRDFLDRAFPESARATCLTTSVTLDLRFRSRSRNSFSQFSEPLLVAGGVSHALLIGWILADARLRTRSLWLPIGLHAGWIFANGIFNKLAHREMLALPWLGRNLLVGIVPLCLALVSWALIRLWLKHVERSRSESVPRSSSRLFYPPFCAVCARPIEPRNIFAPIAPTKRRGSGRPSARIARSLCRGHHRTHSPARIARIASCISTPRSPPIAVAASCGKLIHDFKYSRQDPSPPSSRTLAGRHARGSPPGRTPASISSSRFRCIRRDNANADLIRRSCSRRTARRPAGLPDTPRFATDPLHHYPDPFDRAERMENLHDAFRLRRNSDVRDLRVFLIDDVLTTGSTLSECARVLQSAGAISVHAATAARGLSLWPFSRNLPLRRAAKSARCRRASGKNAPAAAKWCTRSSSRRTTASVRAANIISRNRPRSGSRTFSIPESFVELDATHVGRHPPVSGHGQLQGSPAQIPGQTGLVDAVLSGHGLIEGYKVAIAVMDFSLSRRHHGLGRGRADHARDRVWNGEALRRHHHLGLGRRAHV